MSEGQYGMGKAGAALGAWLHYPTLFVSFLYVLALYTVTLFSFLIFMSFYQIEIFLRKYNLHFSKRQNTDI